MVNMLYNEIAIRSVDPFGIRGVIERAININFVTRNSYCIGI